MKVKNTTICALYIDLILYFAVNLIVLSHGNILGWFSPAVSLFSTPKTPLKEDLSIEQISWLATVLSISTIFGTLISGVFLELFGYRFALMFMALPHIVSHLRFCSVYECGFL